MDPYGGGGGYQQQPYYQQDMGGYGAPPQQWNAGPQGGGFPGGPPRDFTPLDFPNYYATGPPAYPTSPAWGPAPPQGKYLQQ